MITRVQVKNYRSLRDVDVTLGPLNVLVGKNGAGKSAFLDVLAFVRDAITGSIRFAIEERKGLEAVTYAFVKPTQQIDLVFEIETLTYWATYELRLSPNGSLVEYEAARAGIGRSNIGFSDSLESWEAHDGQWIWELDSDRFKEAHDRLGNPIGLAGVGGLVLPVLVSLFPRTNQLFETLRDTNSYDFIVSQLREPHKPSAYSDLSSDGENLASIILKIQEINIYYDALITAFNRITGVRDVRIIKTGAYNSIEVERIAHSGKAAWLPLDQESDGTIRVLGILVAIYQPVLRTTLCINEPELHLHPGALPIIADIIKEASIRRQVIITTQSPDLISRFAADELRIVQNVDGETKIGKIEERQKEIINAELFSGGDLLRIEGLHPAGIANA